VHNFLITLRVALNAAHKQNTERYALYLVRPRSLFRRTFSLWREELPHRLTSGPAPALVLEDHRQQRLLGPSATE
jgi:hypothetical protein